MESKFITTVHIIFLLLLTFSAYRAKGQCHTTTETVVNITEGDPGGIVVYDLNIPNAVSVPHRHQDVLLEYFAGSLSTGVIRTIRTIDRDEIASRIGRSYDHLQITFDFIAINSLDDIACHGVILNINDLNNDHPKFSADSVVVEFAEGSNKSIPLETARDRDEGINSTINYSLVDDLNGLFLIDVRNDSSGFVTQVLLKNSEPLDRESVNQYYLQLRASEGTANPRTAILNLNVTVTDICDVTPSFITSRYFPEPVSEDSPTGTVVFNNITAYDADLVDMDGLLYQINEVCRREMIDSPTCETIADGQHPFLLDMENGLLTLDEELDREEYARYEVSIHATDQCMRSATATVVVLVDDVNDNCPQIDYTSSGVNNEISETLRFFPNTVGFFVIHDRDSGNNSLLQVELFENVSGLLTPSNIFSLNNNEGILEVNQPVDREVQSSYSLVVKATDFGTPRCSSYYNLIVTVTDSNDNPPIFQPILPLFKIREDAQENSMVVSLLATDEDAEESGSGLVTYYLPESNESFPHQHLFKIENVTGLLKLATSLDREELENISVLVEVRDNPQFSPILNNLVLTDNIVVNISIVDVNDNPPIIHYPLGSIEVSEDYIPSTLLFSINATDLDTPPHSTLTYQISTSGPFTINQNNGMVFLNSDGLNFEMSTQYAVSISVTDMEFTTMRDINIVVLNINDERPQFIRQPPIYNGNVEEENQNSGQTVATIEVVDADNPPESLLFQIESGNERGHFTIGPISGQLTTTTSLDKEDVANYTLIVSITDGTFFAERNAVIYVMVLDINDNPPTFVGLPYNFRVSEEYPENTVVRGASENDVVRAIDLDSAMNGVITYAILGSNPTIAESWFSINEDSGEITTNIVFDRESTDLGDGVIQLSVGARNPTSGMGHTDDIAIVSITVLDINDQRPIFETPEVEIGLSENHETGSPFLTVHAIDSDQAPNNETEYTILNTIPGILERFFIHPMTGELNLLQSLDHETEDRIVFQVRAQDVNERVWQAFQTININVIDAPDPCLKLINFVPFVNLQENAPTGTPVVTFEATNLQGESVSTVVYTLKNVDGTPSLAFDISEGQDLQATVHTAVRNIDRESLISQGNNQATYRLNITAHDTVSSLECVIISSVLTITILDENDNPPAFSSELYELTILENTPGGTYVGSVSATDPDLEENSTVTYLIQQTDDVIPFTINDEGQISSTQELDHDSPSGSLYEFIVVGQDGGFVPQTSTTTVRVQVLDVNDNVPEFDRNQNRTFLVLEDSAVNVTVATILVSDADSGSFGEVTVSILPGRRLNEHFQLQQDGSICLVQELDRELEDMYSFEVQAIDGGGEKAMAMIQIVVGDVNDNAPIFNLEPINTITIPENYQTRVNFTNVTARDADIGLNGQVHYVLADESLSTIFTVHGTTGQISLGSSSCLRPSDNRHITSIDYERLSSYEVTILAYDQSFPRHFASKTINIAITNINEHAPEFDRSIVVVSVNEGQNVGTEVIQIKAYDWDYDSLTYSILEDGENSVHFRYQDESIVTTTVFDYNVKSMYFLTLTAQELSTDERQLGSVFVEVLVNNVNNHQPVFETMDYPTSTDISESTAPGNIILTVHATDPDNATHDAVSYEIVRGNEDNVFSIDSLTGDISVSSLLDYDSITSYALTVVAKDTGVPQRTSTSLELTVTLENVNDESPIFRNGSYEFGLFENRQLKSLVGQVEASDGDREPFNSVKYFLPFGAGGYFDVDENSGDIFSLMEVDREGDIASMFPVVFSIVAMDNGRPPRTASAQVSVSIVDINDNPPVFSRHLYYQSIIQSQAPGVPIFNLASEVVDRDQGQNAEIRFEIRSQLQGGLFKLSSSGQILLNESLPLDPELLYEIEVRASDNLDESMYDEAIVRIVVESENGHHPIFDSADGYLVEVGEDVSTPSSIFRMGEHVTDSDSNSQLSFWFKQDHPEYSIDTSTGMVTVIQTLDFEMVKLYTLTVEVIDNTQRTSETTLTVSVTGVNDNTPVFNNIPSTLVLSHVPYANINLFTVQANDLDEGADGHVEYSVAENGRVSVYFAIDPMTGTVKTKGALSVGQTFFLTVTAFDGGIDPLKSTTANITITIRNTSVQSVPVFQGISSTPLIVNVNEDRESGMLSQLTTLPSPDGYAIVSSDAPSELFKIVSSQGRLTLHSILSRRDYELVIEAFIEDTEDLRSVVRYSSYLPIQVRVLDVNNNFPQFSSGDSASISEDADVGSLVFTVYAFDEDIGVNGILNYDITGGNFERVFSINETSGEITLRGSLDREQYSSYDLMIRAFDLNVINPKFMEMILHINVLDVNDYPPRFVKDGNYSLGIYEYPHTKSGERIVRLSAIDLDEGPPLRYDLFIVEARHRGSVVSSPSSAAVDMFQVNRDSGMISLRSNVQLDYETVDYYLLRVQASDTQTVAVTHLEFNIFDVNDHSPEIIYEQQTIVEIWEQQPIGSVITKGITSSDVDRESNGLVTYSLGEEWAQAGDTFMIDPHTGVIRVKNPIVFSPSIFQLSGTVYASDNGIPRRNVSIVMDVHIFDVNDNSPVFGQSAYAFPISVNAPTGSPIGTVTAQDTKDYRENTAITMIIPYYYSEARRFFNFASNGSLTLIPVQGLEARNYTFRIQALSPSFCPDCPQYNKIAYTDVTIILYPPCPNFLSIDHMVDVSEGQASQDMLFTLSAVSSVGRQVEYLINNSTEQPFTINKYSGQVSLASTLDRESIDSYQFFVSAIDSMFQPSTCSVLVTVNVLDINDNSPVFQSMHYNAFIKENSPTPVAITTVTASDQDLGSNGTVEYEIAASPDIPFSIERQTGRIIATSPFDAEDIASYEFQIRAVDNGPERREGFASVIVTVTDVNEFTPTFPKAVYTFIDISPERFSKGSIIGTVRANDLDQSSQLTYSFLNEAPKLFFDINNRTGDIYLIVSQNTGGVTFSKRDIHKRQLQTDTTSDFFPVNAIVQASDGDYNVTTEVQFSLHTSFMPSTLPEGFDIIIIVVGSVIAVVVAFILLLGIIVLCRRKKRSRKEQINPTRIEIELGTRFSSRRSQGSRSNTPSQYRQTNIGKSFNSDKPIKALHHSSGSGSNSSRQSYANYADDEMDSNNGENPTRSAYHSQGLTKKLSHPSPPNRSTSDLASSVSTDILGSDPLPHPKARIAAIYAAHHGLLNNHGSQESIHSNHTFASEGGGEADAEADIENMLYSKYEFEDDDDNITIPDDSSYIGKERQSMHMSDSGNLNVPPVEEDLQTYSYSQTVTDWVPRGIPMEHTIDELNQLASYPSTVSQEDHHISAQRSNHYTGSYDQSQQMSMYGASSQGSRISLLRHHTGGHPQPRRFNAPPQVAQPQPHEYDYYGIPRHDPRYHQYFQGKQRYGSANVLSTSREYEPPREQTGGQRIHNQGIPHNLGLSQDVPSTYHHNSYLQHGVNSRTPSDTPTDGTVTPHRAMGTDYDPTGYLSSSSTSIGSTNLSGTISSIGQSVSQRMYQK